MTSLYFDTPEDLALQQKTDGTDRREKFRLRYYGNDMSLYGWKKDKDKRSVYKGCSKADLRAGGRRYWRAITALCSDPAIRLAMEFTAR